MVAAALNLCTICAVQFPVTFTNQHSWLDLVPEGGIFHIFHSSDCEDAFLYVEVKLFFLIFKICINKLFFRFSKTGKMEIPYLIGFPLCGKDSSLSVHSKQR